MIIQEKFDRLNRLFPNLNEVKKGKKHHQFFVHFVHQTNVFILFLFKLSKQISQFDLFFDRPGARFDSETTFVFALVFHVSSYFSLGLSRVDGRLPSRISSMILRSFQKRISAKIHGFFCAALKNFLNNHVPN